MDCIQQLFLLAYIIASTLLKRAYSQIKISVSISYSYLVNGERCTGRCYFSCLFQNKTKTKEIAIPAAASAFLGITEPAIFGVNLKLGKPFIAAAIGGNWRRLRCLDASSG